MTWPRHKPSKRAVFGSLMLLSAVSLFLVPKRWTDPLKYAGQLLVPLEDPLYRLAQGAASSVTNLDPTRDEDTLERQALLHQLASQVAIAEQLREENARLRALRQGYIPTTVPLLPAKVVARDIVAWRDSLLVERGSSRGVRYRDWVASRFFVDRGRVHEIGEGQAVLTRECLLGRVEQVSPYMARIQLLSDVDGPRIEVRVGTTTHNSFEFVDYPCSLHGLGRGRMIIEDVPYKYVATGIKGEQDDAPGRIRIDDCVISAPGQLGLAEPLVVGKVVEFMEDPHKRLVVSLMVEPILTMDQISDVFIIPLIPFDRLPTRN